MFEGGIKLHRDEKVIWRVFDDQIVLLHPKTGQYAGLEGVGAFIWHMLQEPLSIPDIAGRIAAEYEEDADVIERDVVSFCEDLVQEGLLELTK